jgi:hypothetical protein
MISKFLFQNRKKQEGKQLLSARNMLPLLLVVLTCGLSFGATLVVNQGSGPYYGIQDAINVAGPNDIIEVQGSYTYGGNLKFKNDVNGITLKATGGATIQVFGPTVPDENCIDVRSVRTTIDGFHITFSGTPLATDANIIHGLGGASTVKNCVIVGPGSGRLRGITGIAEINNVDISGCRRGLVCDINEIASGFSYIVSNSKFHNNANRGVAFTNCTATMDNCEIYSNGNSTDADGSGNFLIDGNEPESVGRTNVIITNSILRNSLYGRLLNVETTGTITMNDCIIRDVPNNDAILQRGGTLNMNRCFVHVGDAGTGGRAFLNQASNAQYTGGITNIDHCTIEGDETRPIPNQWAIVLASAVDSNVTIKNSIVRAAQGFFESDGTIHSNYNCVFASMTAYEAQGPLPGEFDIQDDPLWIQTTTPGLETYYALQPYSPCVGADENGNDMGAFPVVEGYEQWPSDLGGVHGVDLVDFSLFGSHWRQNNAYVVDVNYTVENFETYSGTGASGVVGTLLGPRTVGGPDVWRNPLYTYPGTLGLPTWTAYGWSTLTLETGADANSGSGGTKMMRWVYDVNVTPDVNQVQYTEVLGVLPAAYDLNKYRTIRVMLKRHSGNSPEAETFMYARFLDMSKYNAGVPNRQDIVRTVTGGSTDTHPDEWYAWTINIAIPDVVPTGFWQQNGTTTNWSRIDAIMFGIQTQAKESAELPYGHGQGTIDVDTIQLGMPACSGYPVGDYNQDCVVNFDDLEYFLRFWLDGK